MGNSFSLFTANLFISIHETKMKSEIDISLEFGESLRDFLYHQILSAAVLRTIKLKMQQQIFDGRRSEQAVSFPR